MRAWGRSVLMVACVSSLSGCGGDDDDDDSGGGSNLPVLARIGDEGGTFTLGGVAGTVPPGAVEAGGTLVIHGEIAEGVDPPEGAIGDVFAIEVDGTLREPVTLEFPYEQVALGGRSALGLQVASSPDGIVWDCEPMTAPRESSSSLLAVASHFSFWVLRFEPCPCAAPQQCVGEGDSSFCALTCANDTDCPEPTYCQCGICRHLSSEDGEGCLDSTHPSVDEGRGVCLPACTPFARCGVPSEQQICTPGGRCIFQETAVCEERFTCADDHECLHQWCVNESSGCVCDDDCTCAPPEDQCPDAEHEGCVDTTDDDGDGLAGCADPDCADEPGCTAGVPENCLSPGDEDDDGAADCDDDACVDAPRCLSGYQGARVLAVAQEWMTICALLDGGKLKCFGHDLSGANGQGDQVETDADDLAGLPPIDVGTGRVVRDFDAGRQVCAILDDDTLKCWGFNVFGALGLGDDVSRGTAPGQMGDALPPVDLGTGRTAKVVVVGSGLRSNHTCAILDDDTLKCWGGNAWGQLGLGDIDDRGDEPGEMGDALPAVDLGAGRFAVAVGASDASTCAVLDDESLRCWGLNEFGGLGLGDTDSRGDAPGEMGDALPPVPLASPVLAVAPAAEAACALLEGDVVECWGETAQGLSGRFPVVLRGDEPGELDDLEPIELGTGRTVQQLAVGFAHACVLLDDETVKCWGANGVAQLGHGGDAQDALGDDAGEMGDALPVVPLGGRPARIVSTGTYDSCAVLDDDSLHCWGNFDMEPLDPIDPGVWEVVEDCAFFGDEEGDGLADCDDPECDCGGGPGCDDAETCDDGLDNDCDGAIDQGCACPADATQRCYGGAGATRGVGQCHDGVLVCGAGGTWGDECLGEVRPGVEACNGQDDDCDGVVDDVGGGCADSPLSCPSNLSTAVFSTIALDAAAFFDGDVSACHWTVECPLGGDCPQPEDPDACQTTLYADAQGDLQVSVSFEDDLAAPYACAWVIQVSSPGLRVEVTWEGNLDQDVDLHLHRDVDPDTAWFAGDDCHFANCNAAAPLGRLDWGYPLTPVDECPPAPVGSAWNYVALGGCPNPRLDVDDLDGPGPENITIDAPNDGDGFRVMVQYYDGVGEANPTVRIYCGGELVSQSGPVALTTLGPSMGELWRVADITWNGEGCDVVSRVDDIQPSDSQDVY